MQRLIGLHNDGHGLTCKRYLYSVQETQKHIYTQCIQMYLLENRPFMCTILTRKLPSVPKTAAGPSIPNYPDPKTVVATKEKQRRDINTPKQQSIILNKCDFGFYACDAVGFV